MVFALFSSRRVSDKENSLRIKSFGMEKHRCTCMKFSINIFVTHTVCHSSRISCTHLFSICVYFSFFSTLHPPDATYVIIVLLASLNSCTNPWIYMIYTEGICSKLRGFVTDNRMSGKRRKLSTFFTFDDRSRGTL